MLKITIATIFPEVFPGPLGVSLLKKSLNIIWQLEIINLRNYGHKGRIDDKIFGGFPGMIIKPEVMEKFLESSKWNKILYTNPTGTLLNQPYLQKLSDIINGFKEDYKLLIICGRYEGIDARVVDYYNIEEFSLGEFVLCGGELPAMVLVEGLIRLFPEVLGNGKSLENESFTDGTYHQYPKYTRPRIWKNLEVPEVLINGNHGLIKKWTKHK
jgi:tRNA (guanine37-N1)-methyltransferase